MPGSADAILAAIERHPAVKVQIDDARPSAAVRVGARVVAHVDLRRGGVLVSAPADTVPTLQRLFPSCRPTADGIAFDLVGCECRSEALAAIRRRVNVEHLSWQSRAASP